MRYRLRTLLILLALLPPFLWGGFALWQRYEAWRDSRLAEGRSIIVTTGPAAVTLPIHVDEWDWKRDYQFPPPCHDMLETQEVESHR
jgi:hypothetical protein